MNRRTLVPMRGLSRFALFLCCLALPVAAQRGGGARGGGGFGGGHAGGGFHGGSSGFASRGGPSGSAMRGGAPSVRTGFGGSARFPGAGVRSPYAAQGFRSAPRGFAPRVSAARPAFYTRDGRGYTGVAGYRGGYGSYGARGARFRSPYFGYGYSGLFFSPFFGLDFLDWDSLDTFGFDSPGYGGQAYGSYAPQPSYADEAPYGSQAEAYPAPANQQSDLSPAPGPWAPGFYPATSRLPEEDAVTLIFKDGRPPVQVRNYALTRSALYLPGDHARVIPLDEIDLAATERINRAAGVNFQLP